MTYFPPQSKKEKKSSCFSGFIFTDEKNKETKKD